MKTLKRLEIKNRKFKRKITTVQINKLKHKLENPDCFNKDPNEMSIEKMLEITDLKTTNFDLKKDFEKSIGKSA